MDPLHYSGLFLFLTPMVKLVFSLYAVEDSYLSIRKPLINPANFVSFTQAIASNAFVPCVKIAYIK